MRPHGVSGTAVPDRYLTRSSSPSDAPVLGISTLDSSVTPLGVRTTPKQLPCRPSSQRETRATARCPEMAANPSRFSRAKVNPPLARATKKRTRTDPRRACRAAASSFGCPTAGAGQGSSMAPIVRRWSRNRRLYGRSRLQRSSDGQSLLSMQGVWEVKQFWKPGSLLATKAPARKLTRQRARAAMMRAATPRALRVTSEDFDDQGDQTRRLREISTRCPRSGSVAGGSAWVPLIHDVAVPRGPRSRRLAADLVR